MQTPWDSIDWTILQDLRARYLAPGDAGVADYWKNTSYLQHYDRTFAQRIGWKWDAVLAELQVRCPSVVSGQLANGRVLDFACGTGIASRKWLDCFGEQAEIGFFDRSVMAAKFAQQQALLEFPQAHTSIVDHQALSNNWDVVLISHVINEMGRSGVEALVKLIARARLVILVEPGTPQVAALLRELRARVQSSHLVLAPCTHNQVCGMGAPERGGDWCHHFAKPPSEVFRDAGWATFSKRMGIDLRSLPVSHLVLAAHHLQQSLSLPTLPGRLIGRPRFYKGYAKALRCNESGVEEWVLQKRDAPRLLKDLEKQQNFTTYI